MTTMYTQCIMSTMHNEDNTVQCAMKTMHNEHNLDTMHNEYNTQ